ncbi:MAG: hypothetical protein B7Z10_04860 [Rhodobacterales bacterium 32-66-7]|nr:MAG: hypothetical protein B7Z10_04860 [Rhodobacterales bacterium 32-66-7]
MPVLVRLQYCVIAMYSNDHNPPHFHILGFDGREAEMRLANLEVAKGNVDRRAIKEAVAWAEPRLDKLKETWNDLQS